MDVKLILNFICSVIISIMVIILAAKFTISFKPIYYISIKPLNINNYSLLNEAEIKKSYNYVVDFLLENNKYDFNIPNFKSSLNGKSHFYEVKAFLKKLDILFYILYGSIIVITFLRCSKINISILKYSSIILFCLMICIFLLFSLNFDKCFTLFHQIVFKNKNWLFSPVEDPIINILPEKFFLLCAILIISLVLLICVIFLKVYKTFINSTMSFFS